MLTDIGTVEARTGNRAPAVFFALLIALVALSFTPRIHSNPTLLYTFWALAALCFGWFVLVSMAYRKSGQVMAYKLNIVTSHYVQGLIQLSIFVYWSFYWEIIGHTGLLILAQLLFAYVFDMLLSWSRRKPWRISFGPFPIIFSTNLFLCFKDEWFYWQFVIVALAFLAKEFLTWERDGKRTHIFNPSAFPLFIFSMVLLVADGTHLTWAPQLAVRLNDPQYIYLHIFIVGLIVQALFRVTLVTLMAALALFLLNVTYTAATGNYWFLDAGIPIAVFLGLHLLVTDPATSPRNDIGRCLFGLLYGILVFLAYGLLESMGKSSFYDKLLCVPLLNLLVIQLEGLGREGGALSRLVARTGMTSIAVIGPRYQNQLAMGAWVALFGVMYSLHLVGPDHPGQNDEFWQQACEEYVTGACRNMERRYNNQCASGSALACARLADRLSHAESEYRGYDVLEALVLGCEYGHEHSCSRISQSMTTDVVARLEDSCDGGDGMACYVLGTNRLKGFGQAPDLSLALDYVRRSCEAGLPLGCMLTGDFHYFGVAVAKDISESIPFYARACTDANALACQKLSEIYRMPDVDWHSPELAVRFHREACAIGLPCTDSN